jgi:hypothetical protein
MMIQFSLDNVSYILALIVSAVRSLITNIFAVLASGVLHFANLLSLAEVKASVSEQKYPYTHLTRDESQDPLNESQVSYSETTSPHV